MDSNYNSQTKSNLKIKIIISFLVIVLLSGAYYFLLLKNKEPNEDSPPGLELGSGGFQGSIEDGRGFLQYTAEDVEKDQTSTLNYTQNELKKGLHVYYSTSDISISNLLLRIKAVEHNKILILFFSPEEKDGLSKGMYAYPKGPYTNTKLITAPDSFIIPAYRGFLMISTKDTNIYGIENEKNLWEMMLHHLLLFILF